MVRRVLRGVLYVIEALTVLVHMLTLRKRQ